MLKKVIKPKNEISYFATFTRFFDGFVKSSSRAFERYPEHAFSSKTNRDIELGKSMRDFGTFPRTFERTLLGAAWTDFADQ